MPPKEGDEAALASAPDWGWLGEIEDVTEDATMAKLVPILEGWDHKGEEDKDKIG